MGWRRLGLIALGFWFIALGISHSGIANTANLPSLFPEIGGPCLITAGAAVLYLFARPSSKIAYRIVAVFGVAGLVVRPVVVMMNVAAGFTVSGWAVLTALLLYLPLAVLIGWWWIWHVGPWLGRRRAGATVPGD